MPIRQDSEHYKLILTYRCPSCNGRGAVQQNTDKHTRTFVMHQSDCRIFRTIEAFWPILLKRRNEGNLLV